MARARLVHASMQDDDKGARRIGIAVALLLHAAVVAALLSYAPFRHALMETAPVMVSYLVAPPVAVPDELPKPLPVKQIRPKAPQPTAPSPLLAITTDSAAPSPTPVPEVATPLPPIQETTRATEAAPAPPPALIPPNFNAAYLDNPAPAYPPLARRSGEQGRVLVRVLVSVAGAADAVELRSSSGSTRLDNAALDTVKRWRFVPARRGDQAVTAWVLVPINFTLEN